MSKQYQVQLAYIQGMITGIKNNILSYPLALVDVGRTESQVAPKEGSLADWALGQVNQTLPDENKIIGIDFRTSQSLATLEFDVSDLMLEANSDLDNIKSMINDNVINICAGYEADENGRYVFTNISPSNPATTSEVLIIEGFTNDGAKPIVDNGLVVLDAPYISGVISSGTLIEVSDKRIKTTNYTVDGTTLTLDYNFGKNEGGVQMTLKKWDSDYQPLDDEVKTIVGAKLATGSEDFSVDGVSKYQVQFIQNDVILRAEEPEYLG